MAKSFDLFGVIAALQYSKAWLEGFQHNALSCAKDFNLGKDIFCDNAQDAAQGTDAELSITVWHEIDPENDSFFDQLHYVRTLKIALKDYLPHLKDGEFVKERKAAIATAFKLLNAQIQAIESYNERENDKVCVRLEIDPSYDSEARQAVHFLDLETQLLIKDGFKA